MKQVTLEEASRGLSDLVDAAVSGEEIVVVRSDQAGVRLVPIDAASQMRPHFGSARGQIQIADDFDAPLEDFREYSE
jgi:antitoxin (DNA-binding transcriptional repressor) of toxin-antitoxin stability system